MSYKLSQSGQLMLCGMDVIADCSNQEACAALVTKANEHEKMISQLRELSAFAASLSDTEFRGAMLAFFKGRAL